jgi:DNA mismatch repair ATPase MutS
MASRETTEQLRELLDRLEERRAELESAEDAAAVVDLLQDLADLAKQAQATIEEARRAGPRDAPA